MWWKNNISITAKKDGKYSLTQNDAIATKIFVANLSTAPNEMIS